MIGLEYWVVALFRVSTNQMRPFGLKVHPDAYAMGMKEKPNFWQDLYA